MCLFVRLFERERCRLRWRNKKEETAISQKKATGEGNKVSTTRSEGKKKRDESPSGGSQRVRARQEPAIS